MLSQDFERAFFISSPITKLHTDGANSPHKQRKDDYVIPQLHYLQGV